MSNVLPLPSIPAAPDRIQDAGVAASCGEAVDCGSEESCGAAPSTERLDGAGAPCPTPLVWQEVRESFLRDSQPWEIRRGAHRLIGRSWGNGPPLYFINNFATPSELFALTIWLLRENFRCVVYDALTNDVKSARQERPSMELFAADLFTIADRHGDDRFTIYGAGFGAGIGLQAALQQPERVNRLILQHGFACRKLSFFERLLARVCLRSNRSLRQLPQRARFQAVNHKPWFPPFDSSRFDFLVESSGELPLRDLARRALAMDAFNVAHQLAQVHCPILMIRTEGEGRVAAQDQDRLQAELPSVHVEWLHSAGQHPCLTHPHRVVKLLQSFLLLESP